MDSFISESRSRGIKWLEKDGICCVFFRTTEVLTLQTNLRKIYYRYDIKMKGQINFHILIKIMNRFVCILARCRKD